MRMLYTTTTELYFGLFMILDTRESHVYTNFTRTHTQIYHIYYIETIYVAFSVRVFPVFFAL